MLKYFFHRILMLIPVLIGISVIAFALSVMSPGDPVDQLLNPTGEDTYTQEEYDRASARLGLDKPVPVQYFVWLGNLLRGDLGRSFFTQKDIMEQMKKRIPVSMVLACLSMLLTIVAGIGLGTLMALVQGKTADRIIGGFSTVALSVPGFWIAIMLIYICAEQMKILPTSGITSWTGYILPVITLSLPGIGVCARLTRTSILDEAGRQYVLVSDSKGLKHRQTIVRHAFKNAMIPVVTYLGTRFAGIIGGASIVETIFAIPGIGSYAISAIQSRDYYVVQAYVLFSGLVYVLVNILIDVIYLFLNPKMRAGEEI